MINLKSIKGLFKPKQKNSFTIQDFLDGTGVSMKKFVKINVETECSKSIDESCINIDCPYNYFKIHKDELYIEVIQEIQAERKEIKERTQRQMQKHYGNGGVENEC
ncbi:hypothetical protein IKD48_03060 [bacterium]|nr:hypothetical protein [bacterium]